MSAIRLTTINNNKVEQHILSILLPGSMDIPKRADWLITSKIQKLKHCSSPTDEQDG